MEEQLAVIHDGHWGTDEHYSFAGDHYTLTDLDARPKPVQTPHPPLILGGAAGPRAARLAAKYADEYNTVMPTEAEIVERKARIDAACAAAGREPIPFSTMGPIPDGGFDALRAQLESYKSLGVARAFIQHLDHRDLALVERMGRELVPALA
jgi:alkanesulfonate monooxygenase SsuD/methylene tetrahydromethanopterin reductase-like flavin-dependent oxidoreductase (luciferase family)